MASGKNIPGKRKGIPGYDDYDTSVDINEVEPGYEADDKGNLPLSTLPTHFNGDQKLPITWFNNFGIKKTDPQKPDRVPSPYKVILRKLPAGKRLCIYINVNGKNVPKEITPAPDGGKISKEISYKYEVFKDPSDNNVEKIMFYLDVIDPPTGSFP